ncbi:MAG: carbohydrate binding family 9 domain-containing protein [Phycisphaerales bacterium]|nr:carbohydrate binding family 9 domain-containing protein [Phycisphaerales bacterium]
MSRSAAIALIGLGAVAAHAPAQDARPAVRIARTDAPPTIDALLDDACWADAPLIDAFTQVEPNEGAPPSQRTEVRLLFDADHLFIAIRCLDDNADAIVARSMTRDAAHDSDDRVTIVIDTFADRRAGYVFVVSAAGGKRDGLIEKGRTRWEWDGLWDARTAVDEHGWTAEIAIPTRTLSFDPAAPAWGFNAERVIRRTNEVVRWASPRRDTPVTQTGGAGEIAGLEGLHQGLGLTVRPFLTARANIDNDDMDFEPGLDLFYKLNPSTTFALTLNTDFAEAEVDERRVNLTRFPLFFPEKRAFFLEDAGVFEFGGINRSPRPFHSRRIGIVAGEQKDILAGARLTGRSGPARFGLLDVQMQEDDALGEKNLGVARFTYDVLDESSVGVIATNGDPTRRGSNQLVGADFNFRDADALGGAVEASLWIMATHDDPTGAEAENGDPVAFGGRLSWNADPWSFFTFADYVGYDFRPALGFVARPGTREHVANLAYRWRPEDHGLAPSDIVRHVELGAGATVFTELAGDIQTADLELPEIVLVTRSDDSIGVVALVSRDALDEPFEIVPGVVVPTETYDTTGLRVGGATSTARPVSVEASYTHRGFYTGHRDDSFARIEVRPNAVVSASAEYEHSEVSLVEGSFIVRIARLRGRLQFTPELSWDATLQWDNQSDQAGLNTRIRWEIRPGQELFVVYNEGFDTADGEFHSASREATVKLGMTFRF